MNPNRIFLLTLFLLSCWSLCSSYRILAVFPFKGRSHFKVLEQIVIALGDKGHQVDVISAFPPTEPYPNYNIIVKLPKIQTRAHVDYNELNRDLIREMTHQTERELCELLGHPEIAKIVKNPPKDRPYDLVLTQLFVGYQCYSALAYYWNVPVVGVVTTTMYPYNHRMIGSPLNLAIVSKNLRSHQENMTFWDRLYNTVMTRYEIYLYDSRAHAQDALIKKHLGPNMPSYTELEKTMALILTNSHFSFHGIQPKNPAHIEIAGIHIKDDNSIMPANLKKIVDESKNGFIYFSFGSLTRIESFPNETFYKFYKVFRRLAPLRILMKSEQPEALPKGLPSNVYTFPWYPQEQILKHPNIKGFITHGGGLGTQEAVYYGVPVICIPLFADQHINCDIATNKRFGVKLNIGDVQQADIDHAFDEILNNPIYQESVDKLSVAFRDRPLKPRDEAVFWIEYVIRHGKNALRSRSVELEWWQFEQLDVYAFLAGCFITLLCALGLVAQFLIRSLLRKVKLPSADLLASRGKKDN